MERSIIIILWIARTHSLRSPLDVNNVHSLQRRANEYSCIWAGAAAAAHRHRPLGEGYCCCWPTAAGVGLT